MLSLALLLLAPSADPGAANPLYRELIDKGVRISPEVVFKLPEPALPDGLDSAGQRAAIRKVAVKYEYDEFIRPSVVAPHVLELKAEKGAQRIDVYFVAQGKLDALGKENLVTRLTAAPQDKKAELPSSGRDLTDKELQSRKLTPMSTKELQERYAVLDFTVLDRVRVSGVSYSVQTRGPQGLVAAMLLEPRFARDPEFPNQWRPLNRSDDGKLSLGPPSAYAGFGGYARATELKEPAGALFIECHLVFHEPKGWFEGNPNILRSKLPLAIQENVRKLRRELARD